MNIDMTVEKAFVSVNEKETHNNVGGNGESTFHHIMMKMLTGANGVALNIPAGECQHVEYSLTMLESLKTRQLNQSSILIRPTEILS